MEAEMLKKEEIAKSAVENYEKRRADEDKQQKAKIAVLEARLADIEAEEADKAKEDEDALKK